MLIVEKRGFTAGSIWIEHTVCPPNMTIREALAVPWVDPNVWEVRIRRLSLIEQYERDERIQQDIREERLEAENDD